MPRLSYYVSENATTQIGEIIGVLEGNSTSTPLDTSGKSGDFVRCGAGYEQSEYPALYQRLGKVGANSFTPRTSNTAASIGVTYTNNIYVYYGSGGALGTSTDAVTWTARTSGLTSYIRAVVYGNNNYVYQADQGYIFTSTDASTWSYRSLLPGYYYAMVYANGRFVVGGDRVYTSTDSVTWSYSGNYVPGVIYGMTYGNGLFVAVGATSIGADAAKLGTSPTGLDSSWSPRTPVTTGSIFTVIYGNGTYVYGGSSGQMATSTDAITWVARTSGTTSTIYSLNYVNNIFTYVGAGGAIGTSTDGITWTARASGTTNQINSLIYGNGKFVYSTSTGGISTSPNPASTNPADYGYANLTSTQFYVPTFTGSLNPTLTTISAVYSSITFSSYMRAK